MGVLDDAIREHIELQRSHGASEEELTRQEREALGPARREAPKPADQPEPGGEPEPSQEAEPPAPMPDEPVADGDEDFDRQRTQVLTAPDPEAFHDAPVRGDPELKPVDEDDLFGEDEPFAEDPSNAEVIDGEVVDEEEEDVLEETPEFLQETPEHDRLWFEQKPPRDFDFE